MRPLYPLILVTITATLPINDNIQEATKLLKQAAVTAGCPEDRVRMSMRWLGGDKGLEVEVRCAPEF
ncbi:MAG TPA: hypothetical protein VEA69_14720 [Tepidisphaeraceae bacterium]|nr:hypothetical protein [Tepidisphaeraceae bacterium]